MNEIGPNQVRRVGPVVRARKGRLAGVLILAVLSGCDGEPKRESVSGTVVWQGQPLGLGDIVFTSTNSEDLPVGGLVSVGNYSLPNPPGLAAGTYKVQIHARGDATRGDIAPRSAAVADFGIADPRMGEKIPKQYNKETTLQAKVEEGASNVFNFDLTGIRETPKAKTGNRQPVGRVSR